MAAKRKAGIGGGVAFALNTMWGLYAWFNEIRDLPDDASGVVKMLTDPPIYLPWLFAAGSVIFLAWVFWPKDTQKTEPRDIEPEPEPESKSIVSEPEVPTAFVFGTAEDISIDSAGIHGFDRLIDAGSIKRLKISNTEATPKRDDNGQVRPPPKGDDRP